MVDGFIDSESIAVSNTVAQGEIGSRVNSMSKLIQGDKDPSLEYPKIQEAGRFRSVKGVLDGLVYGSSRVAFSGSIRYKSHARNEQCIAGLCLPQRI